MNRPFHRWSVVAIGFIVCFALFFQSQAQQTQNVEKSEDSSNASPDKTVNNGLPKTEQPESSGLQWKREQQIWLKEVERLESSPLNKPDNIHTSIYIVRQPLAQRKAALAAKERGQEYMAGTLNYAMEASTAPLEEFAQRMRKLAFFREQMLRAAGWGNLALANWVNHLIYASLETRAATGNLSEIAVVQNLQSLPSFFWKDWQRIWQVLGREFNVQSVSVANAVPRRQPLSRWLDERFVQVDALGVKYGAMKAVVEKTPGYWPLLAHTREPETIPVKVSPVTHSRDWTDIDVNSAALLDSLELSVRAQRNWIPFYFKQLLKILKGSTQNEEILTFEARDALFSSQPRILAAVKKYAPEVLSHPVDEQIRKIEPKDFWRYWKLVTHRKELLKDRSEFYQKENVIFIPGMILSDST